MPKKTYEDHWLSSFDKPFNSLAEVKNPTEKLPILERIQKLNKLHATYILVFHAGITLSFPEKSLVFSQKYFAKLVEAVLNETPLHSLAEDQAFATEMVWRFLTSIDAKITIAEFKTQTMQMLIKRQGELDKNEKDKPFCQALETGLIQECRKSFVFEVNIDNIEKTWTTLRQICTIAPHCSQPLLAKLIQHCSCWISVKKDHLFLSELQKLDFAQLTILSFQQEPLCLLSQNIHNICEYTVKSKKEHKKLVKYLNRRLVEENFLERKFRENSL